MAPAASSAWRASLRSRADRCVIAMRSAVEVTPSICDSTNPSRAVMPSERTSVCGRGNGAIAGGTRLCAMGGSGGKLGAGGGGGSDGSSVRRSGAGRFVFGL